MDALLAEALFCSTLQPSTEPSRATVSAAVEATLIRLGGDECAARVAQEFGDHPEAAARRMRWCAAMVDATFETAAVR